MLDYLSLDKPDSVRRGGTNRGVDDLIFEAVAPHFTALVANSPALPELFDRKEFRLVEHEMDDTKGERTIGFEYAERAAKSAHLTSGRMLLSRDANWGQTQVKLKDDMNGEKSEAIVTFEFQGKLGNFMKISKHRVLRKGILKGGDTGVSELVGTYDLSLDHDVPDTEFTLSAFGLPEPKGIAWESPSRTWLWFGIAGAGFFALGVLLQRFVRRKALPPEGVS